MRPPANAAQSISERAANALEDVQAQIDGIAATPAFEWVKSSAIDTVLAFVAEDRMVCGLSD